MQLGKKDSEMPGQTASASDHIAPPFTLIKTNPFDLWDPSENLLSASLQCISINEFSFVLLVSSFCYLYADTFSFTSLLSFSCPVLPLGGTSLHGISATYTRTLSLPLLSSLPSGACGQLSGP